MKTRENVGVLDFLAVDNFDFTRKIAQKKLCEKLVKMLGFCQNRILGQKFDFSNSVKKRKLDFTTLFSKRIFNVKSSYESSDFSPR